MKPIAETRYERIYIAGREELRKLKEKWCSITGEIVDEMLEKHPDCNTWLVIVAEGCCQGCTGCRCLAVAPACREILEAMTRQ